MINTNPGREIEFSGPGLDSPELLKYTAKIEERNAFSDRVMAAENHEQLTALYMEAMRLETHGVFDHVEFSLIQDKVYTRFQKLTRLECKRIDRLVEDFTAGKPHKNELQPKADETEATNN